VGSLNAIAKSVIGPPKLDDLGPPWLPNGFYTIALPCGTHRTIRVSTQQSGKLSGKRIMGLLIGPENTMDYEDFAFVNSDGVSTWKRFVGHKQEQYAAIIWDLARGETIDGHSMILSKRCLVCNRPLTTPESNELGIGPTCRERIGV